MTTLLEHAVDEESWAVSAPIQLENVQVAPVHYKGHLPRIQLLPRGESARVPFAPGVYRGTGQETRLSIILDAPSAVEHLERLEQILIQKAREHIPLVENLWSSCIKETPFGKQVKCKINADGSYKVQLVNEALEPMDIPLQDLQRRDVLPIICVRGINVQRAQCGLMLDIAAMICGEKPTHAPPKIEFI